MGPVVHVFLAFGFDHDARERLRAGVAQDDAACGANGAAGLGADVAGLLLAQ